MSQDLNRELARLARAITARRLARDDLASLARHLREARASPALGRDLRVALSALQRCAADLHHHAEAENRTALDHQTADRLPDRLNRRLRRRAQRLERLARTSTRGDPDQAFRCIEDLRRCRADADGSLVWCHVAAAVCLLRAILPALTPPSR